MYYHILPVFIDTTLFQAAIKAEFDDNSTAILQKLETTVNKNTKGKGYFVGSNVSRLNYIHVPTKIDQQYIFYGLIPCA